MTEPTETPTWRVTHWERNDYGTLLFSVRSPVNDLYTVTLSTEGDWRVRCDGYDTVDLQTVRRVRRIAARHLIEKAFGRKD